MNFFIWLIKTGQTAFKAMGQIENAGEQGKKWYKSKTIWINIVAALGLIIQKAFGGHVIMSAEDQASLLVVVNLVLRLISKGSVGFYTPKEDIKDD